jgi:protein SCO1/2
MGRHGRPLAILLLLGAALARPAAAADVRQEAGIDAARLGAALPRDVVLSDPAGRATALGDLLGQRPLLLAPVDYHCKNICGLTLADLFAALQQLDWAPGREYDVVVVSIDPAATAEDAAAAARRGLQGVHFLAGDASRLTEAIGFRYGYDAESDQYAHPAAVVVVTADGRLARWLYGYPFEPADLKLALTEAGGGSIGTIGDRLWLLCHAYDPTTGRYTTAVDRLLEAGGGVTVLLLGGFVLIALKREGRRARGDS